MLHSSLIGGSADLKLVAEGTRRIQAPESSDAVARIQIGGNAEFGQNSTLRLKACD
jgi:hypothetical protein